MGRLSAWIFIVFAAIPCQALVRVGFLEIYRPDGSLVQLEPGGRFAHVAIEIEGRWLHAHPIRGVEWTTLEGLHEIGRLAVVRNLDLELPLKLVSAFLGRPYDSDFDWSDDKIYCSELVGKLLGIPPQPMYFDPKLWPPYFQKKNGLPGISPDRIYEILVRSSTYEPAPLWFETLGSLEMTT